jgi:hypothetical protein
MLAHPSTIGQCAAAAVLAILSCPALAQSEPDEIDQYLAALMKNVIVVRQVTEKHGELISCVDIDHQPWMDKLPRPVHRELSPEGKATFERAFGPIVPAPPSELCPEGSVEVILPTRERIVYAGGLRRFMSKDGNGGGSVAPLPFLAASSTGPGAHR